jgi:hypothetical protein
MRNTWIAAAALAAGLSFVLGLTYAVSSGTVPAAQAQEANCPEDVLTAEVNCLRIVKDTNPETEGEDFSFDSSEGDFSLNDDESAALTTGGDSIEVTEEETDGWSLVDINCSETEGVEVTVDQGDRTVTADFSGLDAGEFAEVECTFVNEMEDTPTATATATATTTATATATSTTQATVAVATATRTPVPPTATTVPPVISPPATGSGGLK